MSHHEAIKLAEQFEQVAKELRQAVADGHIVFPQIVIGSHHIGTIYANIEVQLSGVAEHINWEKPAQVLTVRTVGMDTPRPSELSQEKGYVFPYFMDGEYHESETDRMTAGELIKHAGRNPDQFKLVDQALNDYSPDTVIDLYHTNRFFSQYTGPTPNA